MENNNKLIDTYQTNFDDLVAKTTPLVGGNKMEAEDIVQDVFVAQLTQCKYEGRDNASMATYIFSIIKNKVCDMHRNNTRYKHIAYDEEENIPAPAENYFADMEMEEEQSERINVLINAKKNLKAREAQVVDMFYWDNKNQKHIAHTLGTTTGAVEQLLSRAKKRIKKTMQAA